MKPWQLREHDAEIVTMRLNGATLEEIAERFGASKEGIRYAIARHMVKLEKEKAASNGPIDSDAARKSA